MSILLGDHFQCFPRHGAQLFIAAHECHLHVFQLQQHLGGKRIEGIDDEALDDTERHAHFQQALAQGHARRFRKDEGQHAFGRAAPVQGLGQAQGQGRRLGRAGIGVDQDHFLLRRLDGDLLRRGRDAFWNELRGVICTQGYPEMMSVLGALPGAGAQAGKDVAPFGRVEGAHAGRMQAQRRGEGRAAQHLVLHEIRR